MEICDDCGKPQNKRHIIHINTHTYIDNKGSERVAAQLHICADCTLDRFGHMKK